MLVSSVARPDRVLPPLAVAVGVLAVVLALGRGLHPSGAVFLSAVLWVIAVGSLATAAYLWWVCRRPLAAAGTLVTAASVLIAFLASSQPWLVWTVLFFVGLGLIAVETRRDTLAGGVWPLALLRVVVGWAWVDNAQDHFWSSQWFAGSGGQYAQVANGAVSRPRSGPSTRSTRASSRRLSSPTLTCGPRSRPAASWSSGSCWRSAWSPRWPRSCRCGRAATTSL
jgi:hypothetical protein